MASSPQLQFGMTHLPLNEGYGLQNFPIRRRLVDSYRKALYVTTHVDDF